MTKVGPLLALALAACGSRDSSREHVAFAHLGFDVPGHWNKNVSERRGTSTIVWTPDDNDDKESVTVIRTEAAPAVAATGSPILDGILARAERGLPGARASGTVPVRTPSGLQGVRIDVDYLPPGADGHYHRVHVVLVDAHHNTLVHVIYTARTPDQTLSALGLVLDTIREEV